MSLLDRITSAASAWIGRGSAVQSTPAPAPVERGDSWLNAYTGVGLSTRRTAFAFQETPRLSEMLLEALFVGDGIAARICKAIPDEALRKGLRFHTGDPAVDSALSARFDDLGATDKMHEAWVWARLYGGAALFVGADDGLDPKLPLNPHAVRSVRFLRVLDKRHLTPATWYRDGLDPRCGEPETYWLTQQTINVAVHESRLIRFDGAMTPELRRRGNLSWNDSEIQRCYDALVNFNGANAAAATMLQNASQAIFAVKDLMGTLARDRGDLFRKRMELMDLFRGLARSILIDAEGERYETVESSVLTGVPDAVKVSMLMLSAVSEIPVTVLMGQSPAGLNATGDSDLRIWGARVVAAQSKQLKPRATRLAKLLLLAQDGPTGGVEPESWEVQCPALYESTPKEEADLRKVVADTDKLYLDARVLTTAEVTASRFRPEGWSAETTVDLPARAAQAVQVPGGVAPVAGELPGGGAPAAPAAMNAKDPNAALNGAQVESLVAIIEKVAAGTIPRATGVMLITAAFPIDRVEAEAIVGDVGRDFKPAAVSPDAAPAEVVPVVPGVPGTPAAQTADAVHDAQRMKSALAIVQQVAGRTLSRSAAQGMLTAGCGMTDAQAALVLGDAGESFFTAPAPEHEAEMQRLRDEHAAMAASQRSTKGLLDRLVARIKAGETITGATLFGARAEEPEPTGTPPAV